MVCGLCYLHADYPTVDRLSIAHRDVKPKNVLIRSVGSACLSDSGQSVVLHTRLSDEVVRSDRTGSAAATTTTTTATIMLSNNLVSCGTNFDAVPNAGTLRAAVPPTSVELLQTGTNTTDPTVHTNTQKQVVELLMQSNGVASLCKPRRVWLLYELELGRIDLNPEAMRHLVAIQKHRPYAHTSWFGPRCTLNSIGPLQNLGIPSRKHD
ncbi:unnamed protein product [Echinostoma caproni]|uniref:receptor protein serine/threonine kinase n=1 Tax=Echinostoma caproni TaxID=27848 RepID=A0A183A1T6_9TREM|nr:unnamed protein product [Echinostoma caproni]